MISSPTPSLEVITGCMFSGKTEELIRRLKRAVIAKQMIQVFKPSLDTRQHDVWSRSGSSIGAIALTHPHDVWTHLKPETIVVGFDEVQFFDPALTSVVSELLKKGRRVIAAGLDLDFRGEPFAVTASLLALATEATKTQAVCVHCGENASRTHRIAGGEARVEIGDSEYEACCLPCFHRLTSF